MLSALDQLNELLRRAEEYRVQMPVVFCRHCGATNMIGAIECIECKEAFPQELIQAA